MKFHLSEEQELMQLSIRGIVADACSPVRRRAILDANTDFDAPTWQALMEFGLGGMVVPERYGGSGLGLEDAALAVQSLGESAAPGPFTSHLIAAFALARSDDEEVKARCLPGIATGEAIATVAIGGGWMPHSWTVTLTDGLLNGEVRFVPGADVASIFIVGVAGGALALAAAGPQVEVRPLNCADRTRRVWSVRFVGAPATLIADPTVRASQAAVDAALTVIAADALGGAESCLNIAVDYAKTREQFGVVIGQFQAIKHQLANMATEIEPARALVWYAAYAVDADLPEASRAAAHAKAHLADRFVSASRMAVQIHGGIGYTWECDLQIWFRRALFDRAWLGAPSLHRERIAAMAAW